MRFENSKSTNFRVKALKKIIRVKSIKPSFWRLRSQDEIPIRDASTTNLCAISFIERERVPHKRTSNSSTTCGSHKAMLCSIYMLPIYYTYAAAPPHHYPTCLHPQPSTCPIAQLLARFRICRLRNSLLCFLANHKSVTIF